MSQNGAVVLLDAADKPKILRLLMSHGGYADILLEGSRRGDLVATGPGTGMVDQYAILFGDTFNSRPPKIELFKPEVFPDLYRSLSMDARVYSLNYSVGTLKWHCAGLVDRTPEATGWCLPRCVSIVSVRFPGGSITQQAAAHSWGQSEGQLLNENDAQAFARFANACLGWGMKIIVKPSASVPIDYSWFVGLGVPTVFGNDGHAWVCIGACDDARDGIGRAFPGVGVIDPTDGQEHWLTTNEFGRRIKFAVQAPGGPC